MLLHPSTRGYDTADSIRCIVVDRDLTSVLPIVLKGELSGTEMDQFWNTYGSIHLDHFLVCFSQTK
jgi:hypothetical protein